MIFNSYIFILLFFPVISILFYILNHSKKYQLGSLLLLASSFIFVYYDSFFSLAVLAGSIIFNYILSLIICSKKIIYFHKIVLCIGIVSNLGMLFYFKYYNFFIGNVNKVFSSNFESRDLLMPLGISFITFQQIAFLVDCYRRQVSNHNFITYSIFISYFPHISSGPILLSADLLPQLTELPGKKIDWNRVAQGIYMFVGGLGKKVLLADTFAKAVDWGYSNIEQLNVTSILFVSVAYSIQIYFDFSGYSDMAIGVSKILNLNLPINFNSPYKASTILEFWERWHITLTRFLTKYLYIPLGGSRKGKMRTYINTMVVFLCSGLWHGASWTFILWGAFHGCFMVINKEFKQVFNRIPQIINQLITLLFINFTWILFRAGSLNTLRELIEKMFGSEWGSVHSEIFKCFKISFLWIDIPNGIGLLIFLLAAIFIIFGCKNISEKLESWKYSIFSAFWMLIILIMCVMSLSDVSTFVYSNF